MVRLVLGTTLVAFLYMHSPMRPTGADIGPALSAVAGAAQEQLVTIAAASGPLGPLLAQAALRRTLSVEAPSPAFPAPFVEVTSTATTHAKP